MQRAHGVLGEAHSPWRVKASGTPDAGRHHNPNAQKALMAYLLLGKVDS
jgi:hypothetical protein